MFEPDRARPRSSEQAPQLRVIAANHSNPSQLSGLADARNEAEFCSAWLSLQCNRISGVIAGLLMMPPPGGALSAAVTSWPEQSPYVPDLMRLAERATLERRVAASSNRIGSEGSADFLLAMPIGSAGEPIGVVAVALTVAVGAPLPIPETIAEQLRWGAGWLEALPWAQRSTDALSRVARAASCLDLLAIVGEQSRLQATAVVIATDLSVRLNCDRVSLGIARRDGSIRLRAISHSASFKNQSRLVDAIENAMEEALDQRSSVAYPPLPSTQKSVTLAHRALTERVSVSAASVASVVMRSGNGVQVGAITFERHRKDSFDVEDLKLAEAAAVLLGPMVALHLRANRLIAGRVIDRCSDGLAALFGPRRPALKLSVMIALASAVTLMFASGEHRVTGKSVLEGEVQRAAVAPFDGFIRFAPVRAGDTVKSGALLAALDDRDLVLDQVKWRAERDKLMQRNREALARHDRANLVILESQIRQAEAQLALADEKLARTRIVAPFDGIVVSGDLSQMLSSPVEKGKVLFELAPLDSYRLIVHVSERDVRYVSPQQRGIVALAGMPGDRLPFVLSKITPVSVAEEGRNSFRVEARLTEPHSHLRPGMEGVAKIDAGQRSIAWIWTHSVLEWFRLAAWKYLP